MNTLVEHTGRIVLIGMGATAVMDAWLWLLRRLNVPTLNFALLGRWVGHWRRGRWAHAAIARAAPVRHELVLGWLLHYATGIAFAALLVGLYGMAWAASPSLLPALCVGIGTVVAPLFVVQPALGAASTAASRLRSLANHAVFGCGLYLAALLVNRTL
ncbi:MAG: DUF2938 family protein [Burkholderiales bacterium]|nr:DUF2938 family protein [Burkholderiales bacterium]